MSATMKDHIPNIGPDRITWAIVAGCILLFILSIFALTCAGCSSYTVERRVPIFDASGQFVGESYVKMRRVIPFGGKSVGEDFVDFKDGSKSLIFKHSDDTNLEGTGKTIEAMFAYFAQALMEAGRVAAASQGVTVPVAPVLPPPSEPVP